jgi:glycosyltransferase involved in cell wall biosynthesis
MEKKIKLLMIGDGGAPTGFARVLHSIQKYLPKEDYDIHHLAVNYFGDPHNFNCKMYPAMIPGTDPLGLNRMGSIISFIKPDLIFILNDPWNINEYLRVIKGIKDTKVPPVIVYFPVDAKEQDPDWFRNFDMLSRVIVYTKFGYDEVKKVIPDMKLDIISHGVEKSLFYKKDKLESRKELFTEKNKELLEGWLVLNAGRNQPRKRIDLALKGFALFAEGKPETVKYYSHCGLRDAGWDILKLCKRLGISNRLIITSKTDGVQSVPDDKLNIIYNACDVGINTSLGEGWGLPNVEHAITGAPQIVPDSSSCRELFHDCGLLIPISQYLTYTGMLTDGALVRPEDVAEKLELLYTNKELYNELSEKGYKKFTSPEYSWEEVAKQFDKVFKEVIQ